MRTERTQPSFDFGSRLTPLGKRLLLIYGAIYVLELLCQHWFKIPLVAALYLYPIAHPGFYIWQILTHPFIHDPGSPFGFVINCIVFYFFAAPVEERFGPRGFLTFFYSAAAAGFATGFLFAGVAGFGAPFFGMMPSLLALIVTFGLMNPEATILLMFVLPVKAKYLSYGTIVITILTFLAKVNPHGAYHLGGIALGWLFLMGPQHLLDPKLLYLKYQQWRFERKKARFTVIEGGKDKDEKDKPTYH